LPNLKLNEFFKATFEIGPIMLSIFPVDVISFRMLNCKRAKVGFVRLPDIGGL